MSENFCLRRPERYWIENAFGEAKSVLGLDDYEVRTWLGWHRHMTLCMMAQMFTIEQRFAEREEIPRLSTRDIRTMMASLLADPEQSIDRTCEIISARQEQRWLTQEKRYKKQGELAVFISVGNPTM